MKLCKITCAALAMLAFLMSTSTLHAADALGKIAPKPLFRDKIHDGAADPVLVWNKAEKKWFMFYTNRRANVMGEPGVSWVHGTRIGIAESTDGGATWVYRGTAKIDHGEKDFSHWAPEVLEHNGTYHMYLTLVPGTFSNWSHPRSIIHLTSANLLNWDYQSTLKLSSERVIDACVLRMPSGTWRMWYNDEPDGKSIYYADSPDLYTWTDRGKAIGGRSGEGPKVFRWKERYWMVVDIWDGLGVYSSDDGINWTRQKDNLLKKPGTGLDDKVKGSHPDVVVNEGRAFLFYFTHPGRQGPDANKDGYEQRRSSIQVVELQYANGELTCDRDKPTRILLHPPRPAITNADLPENPLIPQRADPWVMKHDDGNYYFIATVPAYDRIELRRARTIAGLKTEAPKIIWNKHEKGPMSHHIWAPELHHIDGKWYIYFAAGKAEAVWDIRMYVLENESPNPLDGTWTEKGQLKANWESFSLDATTFAHREKRYLSWAQHDPKIGGNTNLYIAEMDTPWSIKGEQVMITKPDFAWEKIGYKVNEGPAVLIRNDRIFLTYSASATDHNYCMGLLTADAASDLLDPKSWSKSPEPVFKSSPETSQYGPGHNSFTIAEDGKTDLLIYHARNYKEIKGEALRNPDRHTRIQPLEWNTNGTPNFGKPIADGPVQE